MELWTKQQVSDLIRGLGTAECWKQYGKIILDEDVDGLTFQHLTIENLIELGFRKLHAQAVVHARTNSQPSSSSSSSSLLSSSSSSSSSLSALSSPPAYSAAENMSDTKALQCQEHRLPFQVYCTQDEQLVCITCITSSHDGHRFQQIDQVFMREKADIEHLVSEATQRSRQWREAAEGVVVMKKQIQVNNDRVIEDLDKFFLYIEQQTRERKEALRMELARVVENKLQILTKQEEELRCAASELERVCGSVTETLQSKKAAECILIRQGLKDQLSEQRKADNFPCEPRCDADNIDLFIDKGKVTTLLQETVELCDDASAMYCEGKGEGLTTAIRNSKNPITITAMNEQQKLICETKDKFKVRVSGRGADNAEVEVEVEKVLMPEFGVFSCAYHLPDSLQPSSPVTVSITLRGAHIKGSPFSVPTQQEKNRKKLGKK